FPSLALLVLLVALCTTVANGAPCTNILPGLERQARGVDVTKLDLIPINPVQSGGGFMSQVTYALPDNVWSTNSIPSGSLAASTHVLMTSNEVRKSFSVNAGVDVTTAKFGFSSSFSYSRTQTTLLKNERKVSTVSAAFSSRRVDLVPGNELVLDQRAQAAINALPARLADGRAAYENFLRQYGTHYISEARFGGIMNVYMETESQYLEKTNAEAVSVQASATFGSILTVKGGYSSSTTNIDSRFTSATTNTIRYYGGSANLLDQNGLSAWMPTIQGDPWLYSTKLNRISDLVRDATKRQALSDAIDDYVMRSYVNVELRRVLDTLPSGVKSSDDVTEVKQRINTMLNKFPLVESDVESLGNDVMSTYRMLIIRYDNTYAQFSTPNAYDRPVNFECPPGKTITGIKSWHLNYHEDRQWQFKCGYTPNLYPLANCRWSGYVNEYDAVVNYKCPGTSAIKGWYSVHYNRREDRRYKFMCCDIQGLGETNCAWSSYKNSWDGPMDFSYCPSEKYINGAYSYHSNHHEDRRWQFYVCTV
ncbi:hypothetical protein BaRGS_00033426, partial [Batillaria attramentaria]